MRTKEGFQKGKQDAYEFDRQIQEAKEWAQHRIMGFRSESPTNQNECAERSAAYSHLQEIEKTNGYLAELRAQFGDDLSRIVSYLFNRERKRGESYVLHDRIREERRQFGNNGFGGGLQGVLTFVRDEIPQFRQEVQGDQFRDGEFYHVHA